MIRNLKAKGKIVRNMGLIKKIAWSFHLSTGLELDDLISQACLAYLEGIDEWNPKRARHTTFMWYVLHSSLKNYIKKQLEYRSFFTHENIELMIETIPYFEELSPDALTIAEIIIKRPRTFASISKENVIKRIHSTLKRRGWNTNKINGGLHDLHLTFN